MEIATSLVLDVGCKKSCHPINFHSGSSPAHEVTVDGSDVSKETQDLSVITSERHCGAADHSVNLLDIISVPLTSLWG